MAEQAKIIERSAEKDGKRWDKTNFEQEVEAMLEWIDKRYEYMDRKYSDKQI